MPTSGDPFPLSPNDRPPSRMTGRASPVWTRVAGVCGGVAAGLLTVVAGLPFPAVRHWLDLQAGDGSADPYTPELHSRLAIAFVVASLLLGVGAAFLWSRGGIVELSMRRCLRQTWRLTARLRPRDRRIVLCLAGIAFVATWVRSEYLFQPMRFDESYTYLQYASQPLYVTVSKYDAPNNHVAHSVLVWASTRLFGESPQSIRLPALLAGVLSVVVASGLVARWGTPLEALMTGFVLSVWSPLVEYSVNARGYTLLHLLVVLLLLVTDAWMRRPSRAAAVAIGVLAGCAVWTIPTAVYPVVMLIVLLVAWTSHDGTPVRRRQRWRDLVVVGVVTAGVAALLYAPILLVSGWKSLLPAAADGLHRDWPELLQQSLRETGSLLLRDQTVWSSGIFVIGLLAAARSQNEFLRCHARAWLIGVCLCVAIVIAQGVVPPPRTWLFLIPWGVCPAICGTYELAVQLPWKLGRQCVLLLVVGVCGVLPLRSMADRHSVLRSTETGVCPDAADVARSLKGQLEDSEPILAVSPVSAPLVYYALHEKLDQHHFDPVRTAADAPATAIVVVGRTPPQSIESVLNELQLSPVFGAEPASELSEFSSAIVYRLHRR